jgi:hypothetical protein
MEEKPKAEKTEVKVIGKISGKLPKEARKVFY